MTESVTTEKVARKNDDQTASHPDVDWKAERTHWDFWLQWVLASALAGIVASGLVVDVTLVWAENMDLYLGVNAAMIGATFGIMQWLVLRRQILNADWWILASVAGWVIGEGIALFATMGFTRILNISISAVVIGAMIGIMQWLVLRHKVYGAKWWILASTMGWTLGELTSLFIEWGAMLRGLVVGAIVGAVVGAVTGFVLVLMLQDSNQEI